MKGQKGKIEGGKVDGKSRNGNNILIELSGSVREIISLLKYENFDIKK